MATTDRHGPRGPAHRAAVRLVGGWGLCLALLLLALPLGLRVVAAGTALRFVAEFLTEGTRPWLSARTDPPTRERLTLPSGDPADLWRPRDRPSGRGLVLVHGLSPEGKDEPRLAWAAGLLARAGLAVLVPTLPAMRAQRLRPQDAAVVAAAIARLAAEPTLRRRLVLIGVSVGTAPTLTAAVAPEAAPHVRLVVSLGGYAEARELVRYFTTGHYAFADTAGQAHVQPALARAFLAANLDLIQDAADRRAVEAALATGTVPAAAGPEARAVLAVLTNRDPSRVDALLAALPPETRALLDALSPARYVGRLAASLLLVHGRGDPAIPHTESLRLAAAADPGRTRLILVDLLAHVEGRTPSWGQARDLLRLVGAVYEFLRG